MKHAKKDVGYIIAGIVFTLIVAWIFGEIICAITHLDVRLLKPLLYYQCSQCEVHRVSADDRLLFELKPGRHCLRDDDKTITINNLGFRDKKRSVKKGRNVFRIVCLGGSNTYGANVQDNQTYPYYLEEILNKKNNGTTYEVWNAGVSAYVLSQKIILAEKIIKKYDPDLLLFQYSNEGRRAFLKKTEYAHYFRTNHMLFWENLKFIPWNRYQIGKVLFRYSYLYRTGVIFLNNFVGIPHNHEFYMGQHLNAPMFFDFYKKCRRKIPILLLLNDALGELNEYDESDPTLKRRIEKDCIYLFRGGYPLPEKARADYLDFMNIHPIAETGAYQWYAEIIAGELDRRGYIK